MDLRECSNNDSFAQCIRKMHLSKAEREKRREEMLKCNHLFVVLEEEHHFLGNHSSDCYYEPRTVECVHCGLTNKYETLEEEIYEYPLSKKTVETEVFHFVFKDSYRSKGWFIEDSVATISDEVLFTYHPGVLYDIACTLKSEATDEERFSMMKELCEMETLRERLKLSNIEDAYDLIERYINQKEKKKNDGQLIKRR